MVRGIILGHGNFAKSLFETAERIVGNQPFVDTLSNEGLSSDTLCERLKVIIEKNKEYESIIFVDLPGGSCTISCAKLMKDNPTLKIICGINLPILIEFFILRESHPLDELISILLKKGRDNIFQLGRKK